MDKGINNTVPLIPRLAPVQGENYYEVTRDWRWGRFTVAAGFKTDGASIPWLFWWFMGGGFRPQFMSAAVMHDWLYSRESSYPGLTQKLADDVFYGLLKRDNVHWIRAWLMWFAVRCFGWVFYKTRVPKNFS